MAIQVSGTTVINNSRKLQNVTGLKTINGTSILGSGDIDVSQSFTFGDVGTYTQGVAFIGRTEEGNTLSGSSIKTYGYYHPSFTSLSTGENFSNHSNFAGNNNLSGTWRQMFDGSQGTSATQARFGLWLRIS